MITLHFHLQPQYKYGLFQINFTTFHCTGRYELNKLTSLPMCGFIAQLVEHHTGIAEVTGSNPVEALIFFQASSFQLLKLENLLRWSLFTFRKLCEIQNWPQKIKLVRQSQIVQSVMQDFQYILSHQRPVCNLLVEGQKITYNYYLSRRF